MDENGKITLEDINSLSIVKKFVCIQSSKYNEEAYNRILELIDAEQAILFDKDTHKIYTLGTYYGGNLSKDDFLYFSSIVNVDEANEIINKIEALKNEDELSIQGSNGIVIELKEGNKISLSIDGSKLISENDTKIDIDNKKYSLGIDENNKLDLKEYESPSIILDDVLIDSRNYGAIMVEIPFEVKGSLDIDEFNTFDVTVENCELVEIDKENKVIKIMTESKYLTPYITISYSDEYISKNEKFTINWDVKCYYGLFSDGIENQIGEFNLNDWKLDNYISIYQKNNEYAYLSCPEKCKPMFIDANRNIQGAWHKTAIVDVINGMNYNVYITDNDNLGQNEWHIINKK